mmetsp:Transcript_6146/g.13233  ORF Transcript_6146/g.13233 Transcript_6146/m.13233 type:complete len:220 (-) Transcript_6146:3029-3688(-)
MSPPTIDACIAACCPSSHWFIVSNFSLRSRYATTDAKLFKRPEPGRRCTHLPVQPKPPGCDQPPATPSVMQKSTFLICTKPRSKISSHFSAFGIWNSSIHPVAAEGGVYSTRPPYRFEFQTTDPHRSPASKCEFQYGTARSQLSASTWRPVSKSCKKRRCQGRNNGPRLDKCPFGCFAAKESYVFGYSVPVRLFSKFTAQLNSANSSSLHRWTSRRSRI